LESLQYGFPLPQVWLHLTAIILSGSPPEFIVFGGLLLICLLIPAMKRRIKAIKNILEQNGGIAEYAVYAGSFIFIAAFCISLKWPLLTWRYLSICLPLIFAAAPAVVINGFRWGKLDMIIRVLILIALVNVTYSFRTFGGGSNDVYKEAQEYISADAAAHSLKAAQCGVWLPDYRPLYYHLEKLPPFTAGDTYDVVYINPNHLNHEGILKTLSDAELSAENVLWIRTSNEKYILKKYLKQN
jgi:hypothetical protein